MKNAKKRELVEKIENFYEELNLVDNISDFASLVKEISKLEKELENMKTEEIIKALKS